MAGLIFHVSLVSLMVSDANLPKFPLKLADFYMFGLVKIILD